MTRQKQVKPKLGLIGAGRWGQRIIETIKTIKDVNLSIVASQNPETANLVPGAKVVTHWQDLLSADLDGVLIATPPHCHGDMLRAFVEARVPIMIEKPLCLDPKEALELQELVVRLGVPVLVDHTQLFHPAYAALKERAAHLGPIRFIYSEGMGYGPFRPNLTALWDWTPHDLALCLNLLKMTPHRVAAIGNDTSVALQLIFEENLQAWITNSNVSFEKRRILNVYFDRKVLVFNDFAENKLMEYEIGFGGGNVSSFRVPTGVAIGDLQKDLPLTRAVRYFAQGIQGGSLADFGLDLACEVVRVLDVAQRCLAASGNV